jgi:hypothetical protein
MGKHWRLMTPPQHLWYFTRPAMERMAENLGATIESNSHPGKIVPLSLIVFQVMRSFHMSRDVADGWSNFGIPLNLLDAMHVVLRKSEISAW